LEVIVKEYIFVAMKRIVKSKYGFSTLNVGDKLIVKAIDLASMKSSLWRYNQTASDKIKFEYKEISASKIEATRVEYL
jgi:hypothetical protein